MELIDAIKQRRSVRCYAERSIDAEKLDALKALVQKINEKADLHFQLITEEPEAFNSRLSHYGNFRNVKNYFALVGKKAKDLNERIGYYGQQLVLLAEQLGLNTCWVALTYSKKKAQVEIAPDETCVCLISLGYGAEKPVRHKSKVFSQVTNIPKGIDVPEWFLRGVDTALFAPTAINQQKFKLILGEDGKSVAAKRGIGYYSKVDLGIVRLNFELGAGKDKFNWTDWKGQHNFLM